MAGQNPIGVRCSPIIENPKSKIQNGFSDAHGRRLRRNAWKFPLKIAAKDRSAQITYGELNARVNQLAHGLLALGVRKGDGVALSVGNRIEHLEIIFATAKIGALAIPLDVKWKALELASVVSAFEPRFIILQEDCAGEFAKAKELKDLGFLKPLSLSSDRTYGGLLTGQSSDEPDVDVSEDDPFAVMLTSGTTGFPKGCLTTQRTLFSTASITPSRKGSARTIPRFFRRRFISMPDDRSRSESFTLAAR